MESIYSSSTHHTRIDGTIRPYRYFNNHDDKSKDGNPWVGVAHGRGARRRGFGGQATFIGWKRSVFKTHTGVPYKEFCPSSPILETVPYDRLYQLNYYTDRELQLVAINYPV